MNYAKYRTQVSYTSSFHFSVEQVDPRGRPDAAEEVRAHEAGEGAEPGRTLQTVARVIFAIFATDALRC